MASPVREEAGPPPRRRLAHFRGAAGELSLRARVNSPRSSQAGMISKLKSGDYRLYSRKKNPKTGKRRNLGTFASKPAAEKHERAVQYFKRH